MREVGKLMVVAAVVLAVLGGIFWSGIGGRWFGRLPGDIHVTGERFSFHFPIATCLILSVVLSLVLWLMRR